MPVAPLLQWGRGLSTPEIRACHRLQASLGSLQWGRGLSTPEISVKRVFGGISTSFNGAGVFRPRKSQLVTEASYDVLASMGPGSFDPGNATLMARIIDEALLQWGRGLSTPEIGKLDSDAVAALPASMGPGSFDPGNGAPAGRVANAAALQWGRGLSTPEIEDGSCQPADLGQLQWGRGLSTPEIRRRGRRDHPAGFASMGPGSFDPGNSECGEDRYDRKTGFNGAGVFRPRK